VYYDIFTSSNVYGANLQNLDAVEVLINQIVKRDRLPSQNSLEARQLLRSAWNIVDICVYNAGKYKNTAKVAYCVSLVLGMGVIVCTVFRNDIAKLFDNEDLPNIAVFVLASILTVLTGMTTFLKPDRRWRELRAVAESVESEIFKFRTRTTQYQSVEKAERHAVETCFQGVIENARLTVVQTAALSGTAFSRKYPATVYMHGQNKDATCKTIDYADFGRDTPVDIEHERLSDNHHSPMKPSKYVKARLIPMLSFYQARIPGKYRGLKITEVTLLFATASIAILAFSGGYTEQTLVVDASGETHQVGAGPASWAAVVAGLISAIMAWQGFVGTDRKLNRYTTGILALQRHLLWWESLTPVEKVSMLNVNRLVSIGEAVKMDEVNAWADAKRSIDSDRDDDGIRADESDAVASHAESQNSEL
jgi:hypothetical protein